MKTAIVTGASRGIGRGISLYLAEKGYRIIAAATRDAADVNEYIAALTSLSPESVYIKCDISDASSRENLISEAKKLGGFEILVNNAGVAPLVREDLLDMSEESFDRLININLKGTFMLSQLAAKALIERETDEPKMIINVTSISADTSSINRGEYCISKAGVSMTTLLFADKLAEYEIPVFEVRPGIIKTPMTDVVSAKYDKLISEGLTPIKRWGTPEDVAKCVLAAASGLIDFGTGTVLNADGGFHIRRL